MKSFRGCWTCRVRRKKCDENSPECHSCATLHITCHYENEKPEWMDGAVKQEEMARSFKRQVKENSHHRRADRARRPSEHNEPAPGNSFNPPISSSGTPLDTISTPCTNGADLVPTCRIPRGSDHIATCAAARTGLDFRWSDTILTTFYLDHVFHFLFPFYHSHPSQGSKAWVLEMMIKSPVVRQATLCQSSYFLSLVEDKAGTNTLWENTLTQTRDAFDVLRKALQVLYESDIKSHLHGAVRIMTSIMQVLRFEITISSFSSYQLHLTAALSLFQQIMDCVDGEESVEKFDTIMSHLGPSSEVLGTQYSQIPSAEQSAFRFSSALLFLDDIINSILLQEQPKLRRHHSILLGNTIASHPALDLEAVTGCKNCVFVHISDIVVLDAWKKECKTTGSLDVIELVQRTTLIKRSLEAYIVSEGLGSEISSEQNRSLLSLLTVPLQAARHSNPSTTCIWAHAALLYLTVVVSGWQTANCDVCYHVCAILRLLTSGLLSSETIRTVVWPFCVAGCLAEQAQESQFRAIAEALQPSSVFGTIHEALAIMESVWRGRNAIDSANYDIAACFRRHGDLILLV